MDIRVECPCGQAYTFAVEPVNSRMPCAVACPVCGADGTQLANQFIELATGAPIPQPPPVPIAAGLRINRAAPPPADVAPTALPLPLAASARAATISRPSKSAGESNNMILGIVGALLGAAVGAGLMYGFFLATGFRFPLLGTGIGLLTGLGARMFYRGTDMGLGVLAACISLFTSAGALYLMFGDAAILGFVSVIISGFVAFRIAS
jgi:hypothetical protein